jgi:hypothetical protein
MHSARPHRTPTVRRALVWPVAALLVGAVLAGCSDDGGKDPEADPSGSGSTSASGSGSPSGSGSATPSPSETPYLPVPDGVELTPQGSGLEIGDSAVVAYEPKQKIVGVLDITVDRLEKTSFKESFQGWKLDETTKQSNPYFVHVTVKNVGDTDLGTLKPELRRIPLYIVDGNNTLVESSSFASAFKPCPSTPLPDEFKPGTKTKACLVYLAPDHGKLTAVSFRPTEDFTPIVWTGEVHKLGEKKDTKGDKKGKGSRG